jgi:hypothetical protein
MPKSYGDAKKGPTKPYSPHYDREQPRGKKMSDHKDFMSDSNTKPNRGGSEEYKER